MPTAEQCLKAGNELGDLVNLLLDEISNKEQITDFAKDGFEAVQALAAVGIPAENKAAVASHVMEGLQHRVNEGALKLA